MTSSPGSSMEKSAAGAPVSRETSARASAARDTASRTAMAASSSRAWSSRPGSIASPPSADVSRETSTPGGLAGASRESPSSTSADEATVAMLALPAATTPTSAPEAVAAPASSALASAAARSGPGRAPAPVALVDSPVGTSTIDGLPFGGPLASPEASAGPGPTPEPPGMTSDGSRPWALCGVARADAASEVPWPSRVRACPSGSPVDDRASLSSPDRETGSSCWESGGSAASSLRCTSLISCGDPISWRRSEGSPVPPLSWASWP